MLLTCLGTRLTLPHHSPALACLPACFSHTGQLKFDADGNLYAAFGDGAQYDAVGEWRVPM